MIAAEVRPWFGPMHAADAALAAKLRSVRSMSLLHKQGWSPNNTLVFNPPARLGYDLDIFVIARAIASPDHTSMLWVLSTIGLCNTRQQQRPGAESFSSFELTMTSNNWEKEAAIPARLATALQLGLENMSGWDWSQVTVPPIVDWLSIAAQELAGAIRRGDTMASGDTLTIGPEHISGIASELIRTVILPAPPPLLAAGMTPFDVHGNPHVGVEASWHNLVKPELSGFYWLLPVSENELRHAAREGTWNMFAELADMAYRGNIDEFSLTMNWRRQTL